jgi:16S rRNA (uracil1498-N3)-methyltransferase
MSRFFIKQTDITSNTINISGEDVNHIKNVLRLKCGNNIILNDCSGTDYIVEIDRFGENCIYTHIIDSYKNETEPGINITLYQGLPKSDKMDLIIQKSIELGIKKIVPVITERTIVKIEDKKSLENKVKRWQRIALEAAKQCNRGFIPLVEFPITYKKALEISKETDLSLIPYEKESSNSLRKYMEQAKKGRIRNVSVIIGPEGGFTENEVEAAIDAGINSVTLGPRILRTETAGIAILSILMYELGDVCS